MLDLALAVILYLMGRSLDKTQVVPQAQVVEEEPIPVGVPTRRTESRCRTYLKEGENWEDLV